VKASNIFHACTGVLISP